MSLSDAAKQLGDSPVSPISIGRLGGFTKREFLAAMAMQGALSGLPPEVDYSPRRTAKVAVQHADALLEALEAELEVSDEPKREGENVGG